METTTTLVIGAGQAGDRYEANTPGAMGMTISCWNAGASPSAGARSAGTRWLLERPGLARPLPNWRLMMSAPTCFRPRNGQGGFEDYARMIQAPVRTGWKRRGARNRKRPGFTVSTSAGEIEARYVVAATGAFQIASYPAIVPAQPSVSSRSIHRPTRTPANWPKARCWWCGAGPRIARGSRN